jgi:methyl-accepting chemotaxis protein
MSMSTKVKLILSFSVIIVINFCFGLYAARSLHILNGRVVEANSWTDGISELGEMQFSITSLRRYDLNYSQQTERQQRENTLQRRSAAIEAAEELMSDYRNDVQTIPYDTEEQRSEDLAAIDLIIGRWKAYLAASQKLLDESDAGNDADVSALINGESLVLFDELEASVEALITFNKEGSQEVMLMSEEIYRAMRRMIIAILLVSTVFSVAVPIFLIKGIRTSIDELLRVSEAIGEGNLTVTARVFANDEFGELAGRYNHTIENIKALVSRMQESAGYMSKAAGDFLGSASRSAEGTDMIARSVEAVSLQSSKQQSETESITTAINGMANGIADMTGKLDVLAHGAEESVRIAKEGGELIERAIAQMKMIESAVNTSSDVVTALGDRSNEIGRIVGTIGSIASQTDLLALNAAIEAARAGELGRGFAVVAGEVKKLAGESQTATEEIARLIASIQKETSLAVDAMRGGKEEVGKGVLAMSDGERAFDALAQRSVESSEGFAGITAAMHSLSSETSGVAAAARSVEESSKEIAKDSQSMAAAAQEQSASMSEVSHASQSLADVASNMLDSTNRFRVQ